ncbi:glycoside hydrolase family 32 protein [Nocardioides eburneiflavus]|uniref:beta-fructofuranosidase n=1 Tax=Nocardioides eburneiflavus TaxID=2518372 RepID=A0A4Z1CJK0_9ACTN|nr:glycoside hydrolase family 32 protein [Nocardioides eburneiflavus]TGN64123.1 glycoside hydrolase family 32 protein [Nocardioides eburneiflavus]
MRPLLHFTAETGWINDPHGLTFHDGAYHLFHQYVPGSLVWAPNCHWGHATSPDLLSWTRRGIALAPGDGDDGIWTGSLVRDGDDARILYTSVVQPDIGLGRVRLAAPTDSTWDEWTKGEVVIVPPEDLDLIAYRDPFVVREGDLWRMFVGAGTRSGDALALTYTSPDLTEWVYDGVAASRSTYETEPVWMGALWECPQVFDVDDHWVMLSSVWDDDVLHYAGYGIGDGDSYGEGRFTPADWGRLSHGGSYYAPSFFRDRDGRPCVMFWMRGVGDADEAWSSCLSVPYLMTAKDGRLVAAPHPELAAARGGPLAAGESAVTFDLEWSPAGPDDHLVLSNDSGAKTARVGVLDGAVSLERPGQDTWSMPWAGEELRIIVDGPVVEISSPQGLLGGAVEPTTRWHGGDPRVRAWQLSPSSSV